MRERPDGDQGTKRGLRSQLWLLMVACQGLMGWLGTWEGGLEAVRAWEGGLETRWEGGFQMSNWLVWLVNRGGRRG